jgi:O-acetyl-ADP-ribose deacetylase (regulator of RNase III)
MIAVTEVKSFLKADISIGTVVFVSYDEENYRCYKIYLSQ